MSIETRLEELEAKGAANAWETPVYLRVYLKLCACTFLKVPPISLLGGNQVGVSLCAGLRLFGLCA
jgi:hypothetical protein